MSARKNFQSKFFKLNTGSLHVILSKRAGLPVIFIHGAHRQHQNAEIWMPFLPALPITVKPVLVDLPGHGKSPVPGSLDNFRDSHLPILTDFIKQAGFKEFLFVGRSYGGWLAMRLASSFPDQTRGLFLIAPLGADKAHRYLSTL
ncbi:MAG: alpha/beta fold hydrolase, partial [Candidatus Odinarchaeota archaeon]